MHTLAVSAHARARMQQRGIPEQVLSVLIRFGKKAYDHRGGKVVYLTPKRKRRLYMAVEKALLRKLEPVLDTYMVLNCEHHVVTVGHRTRRINRN